MKERINGDNTGVVGRSGTIEAVAGSSLDVHGGLEWQTWACELWQWSELNKDEI